MKEILVYGRPGTPMPAWGVRRRRSAHRPAARRAGRLPRVDPDPVRGGAGRSRRRCASELGLATDAAIDYTDPAVGEALFNLGLGDGPRRAGSAPTPAPAATPRARRSSPAPRSPLGADLSELRRLPRRLRRLRPLAALRDRAPAVPHRCPTWSTSSRRAPIDNLLYGQRGQGSGRMPGFGDNPNTLLEQSDGMFTEEHARGRRRLRGQPPPRRQRRRPAGGAEALRAPFDEATTTTHLVPRPPPTAGLSAMGIAHVLAGIAWDPQIRGFLPSGSGVVVLLGSMYLLLVTNVGTRLGFLIAATAFWGWLFIMGVVWWIYGTVGMIGDLAHVAGQRGRLPGHRAGRPRGGPHARRRRARACPPIPRSSSTLDAERADRDRRRGRSPTSAGGRSCSSRTRSFGEAKAAVDEHFVGRAADEALAARQRRRLRRRTYTFERGGKDGLDGRPEPDRPHHAQDLKTLSSSGTRRTTPSSRSSRSLVQETVPGEAPPLPEGRRGQAGRSP